ncbi:MAG: hypothetical protein FWC62_05400 [Firmicutes bacterium]|nr:hypothetical protein [Bacillota bacterium]
MVRDIIYQITVFGDFTSIQPNDETIQRMITKFKDYGLLPSVFQEGIVTLSLDNLAPPKAIDRLQMVSLSKMISVLFARNQIDISKAAIDPEVGVLNTHLRELLDILGKATEGFSFTRVGFNTTSLLDHPNAFLSKKIQPSLAFYDNPNELMLRVNKRDNITFCDDLSERSNIILTVQKTKGQLLINNNRIVIDNGLVLQFDINTIPEITEPRLFAEQTKAYVLSAEQIRQTILTDLVSE